MSWAVEELKTASLGDKRRNQRLIKIVEDLSAMPIASVTQAARDKALCISHIFRKESQNVVTVSKTE